MSNKVWQIWPGKKKAEPSFQCGGKCMSPSKFDGPMVRTGWLGVIGLPGLYFWFCGIEFWRMGGNWKLLVILPLILWFFPIYCYAGACF